MSRPRSRTYRPAAVAHVGGWRFSFDRSWNWPARLEGGWVDEGEAWIGASIGSEGCDPFVAVTRDVHPRRRWLCRLIDWLDT